MIASLTATRDAQAAQLDAAEAKITGFEAQVAGLLTEIEDRYDIVIEDDDVDGEMLETFGGLLAFVETKTIEA